MSKIKILFTIPNFDTAGSTRVVYDLVANLDRSVFDISIACNHDKGAFYQEIEKLGVPIYLINTTIAYKPYFSFFSRLKPIVSFFKLHQFDIIHSWHWSSDWTEVTAAKLAGAKWVFTKKAMSWGNKHWKIRSFLADFIFTINKEMRSYFSYKKNQKLVPLGIDTDYYSPIGFKKPINEVFTIVTVANLVPVKGVEVLIRVIPLLKNVRITIVGDGTPAYVSFLKNLCKDLNVEDSVVFLGRQEDVRPFIAQSDLYVIPTLDEGRKEGMPMALVEAMSMAIPVLGSNISGINYVLKDFPELLFKAGDTNDLAQKIKVLIDNNEQALGETLRDYCIRNFTMQNFIKNNEAVYRKLMKPKSR
ncbi:predicted glycosyltransferase [unidentified eubacterium SCB49]|nr:predicted glycosyltransferase [unidentified eubacterium SCB49]